ncbi:cathelicidin-2-like [Acipenser oxyrinchus oxyrinchus]|uniref:Cathelicidin-2-like n=1 Tax=Acipenser oxyrinchus oxyrinchus TaxID=40147 RepID=A0AAD8LQ31_ACIOX|nr:cathelicidin-2-like [Acipenser oxyrinchus oxyrinchus]
MRTCLKALLLAGLACLLTAALAKKSFNFMDALSVSTVHYNRGSEEKNAFKPPEKNPLRGMDIVIPGDGSPTEMKIKFTLKETVCPKTEDYKKAECVYKENGVSAHLFCSTIPKKTPSEANSVEVTCEHVGPEEPEEELKSQNPWWPFRRLMKKNTCIPKSTPLLYCKFTFLKNI